MADDALPLQIATVSTALLWPLAAGVAVVIWSKARAAARARRMAAADDQLRSMFRTIEAKPVPPKLALVVEALEEGAELTPAAGTGKRKATPARP